MTGIAASSKVAISRSGRFHRADIARDFDPWHGVARRKRLLEPDRRARRRPSGRSRAESAPRGRARPQTLDWPGCGAIAVPNAPPAVSHVRRRLAEVTRRQQPAVGAASSCPAGPASGDRVAVVAPSVRSAWIPLGRRVGQRRSVHRPVQPPLRRGPRCIDRRRSHTHDRSTVIDAAVEGRRPSSWFAPSCSHLRGPVTFCSVTSLRSPR